MAKILFVWELGRGFGHLAPYLDFVAEVRKRGHEVDFIARDVGHAEQIFGRFGVRIHQAPVMMHNINNPYHVQYNLSHLLHNAGLGERVSLSALVKAWRFLYDQVRPDLAIFDHSPTALIASRGYGWKRIVSGSGFLIPPPGVPLPMMRYWQKYDQQKMLEEENRLLEDVNYALASVKAATMKSISEIYATDDMFLLGFEEMDHYPQRKGGHYLGMFSLSNHGKEPTWPGKHERRVFAYLHSFKHIGELMKLLGQGRFDSLIYAPELQEAARKKFSTEHVVFSDDAVDIEKVSAQCAFAITNATFGTTAAFLYHGTPVLCVPSNLERLMVARRVIQMGAGVGVEQQKPERFKGALRAMFTEEKFRQAAQKFHEKYKHRNLRWQTTEMLKILDRNLPPTSRTAAGAA